MTYSPGPSRLNPATRRVLQAIYDLSEQRGVPPSIVDIRNHVGLTSTATVHHHLCTLVRLGLVEEVEP